jgi:hypothetical protein
VHHEEQLLRTAVGIYRSLGLDDPSLSDAVANPLENPGIVTTIVAVFWNSTNEIHRAALPRELPEGARRLGVHLQISTHST